MRTIPIEWRHLDCRGNLSAMWLYGYGCGTGSGNRPLMARNARSELDEHRLEGNNTP